MNQASLPRIILPFLAAATLLSCSPAETPQKLVLTGSSTVAPLAAAIGKRFEQSHPGVRVNVQSGGSSRGIADTRSGLADIGMVSRSLKDTEKELYAFTVAHDGICIVIHRENPVQTLSDKEVVAIYTGDISSWQGLGGPDAEITVVNKAEGRSTLELFLHYFALDNGDIHPHVVIGDNEQGIKTVAGNPYAIGYVSIGTAEYDSTHGVPIKLLSMNGVAASSKSVGNGSFPLARPLNFVTRAVPSGLAKEFIAFARSDAVKDIVREQYFVPLSQ
ncbi:MAG: phosphate ABC transporter substrate-binding protein [Candidatus Binatia bacterium]